MDDAFIPTLSHATERDIDLLLVEELYASLNFTDWMCRQVGLMKPIASWDVKHSKRRTRSRREIDIFLEIDHSDGTRSAILIENKLDAMEQPDQAESYREELAILADNYERSAMLIVCPAGYAAQHHHFTAKFDATVTYETIRDHLRLLADESGHEAVLRCGFRADILDQAVNKYRRGYTPIPDRVVGDFNKLYVSLLAAAAPSIIPGNAMLKPANPRESTSMIFNQALSLSALPVEIRPSRFAHELGRGSDRRANYVAVTFAGWGSALPGVVDRLDADAIELGATFSSKTPNKNRPNPGLVMAIPTEPVDNQGDFDTQTEALEDGMAVALELRRWLHDNQEILLDWKRLIESHNGTQ